MTDDERALLVRALGALRDSNARAERGLGIDGVDSAEVTRQMTFAERAGARPWKSTREVLAARAVLSDPLAVKLLKEADRANR